MASQQKLRNASIMSYFQPQGGRTIKNGQVVETENNKDSKRSLPKSPASRKISRKSLKQVQPTAERSGLTGRSSNKVKKRKHTDDVDESDCKQQPTKVQRIIPSSRPVTVYKDPAPVSKPTPPDCLVDKENVVLLEPRDARREPEGHLEVKDEIQADATVEGHSEVKERSQPEVSTNTSTGECSCTCHQKSTTSKDEQKKEKTAEEEALELMGQEEITPAYWEQLAEERRCALAEALQENEQLHDEVKELKEENGSLSELANKAEYFANMLKLATGADDDGEEDDTDGDEGSKKQEEEEEEGKECDSGLESTQQDSTELHSDSDSDSS